MDGALSEPLVEASSLLARLDAFLDALAGQGVAADVEQRVRLIGLLSRLVATNQLPRGAAALSRLLTPVLARTPAQQAICEDLFRSWFDDVPRAESHDSSKFEAIIKNSLFDESQRNWWSTPYIGRLSKILAAAIVIVTIVVSASYLNPGSEEQTEVQPAPMPPITISVERQITEWLQKYPIQELAVPEQSPWNRSWRWYFTEFDAKKAAIALLPWGLYLSVLGWLVYLVVLHLRREALRNDLHSANWNIARVPGQFGNRSLLAELQPLRSLARENIKVFDVEKTVLETASCAGLPQVKFSDRPIARSFVAFIDRRSRRDHLAEYNIRVINVLRDAGVFVEVFQFDHDPMLCRSANSGEYKGLQEIISGFSESVMLLFVEAEQIMDPATGRLMRWVAFFRDVPHSFLLTPPGDTDPLEFIRHQGRKGSMVHISVSPQGLIDLVKNLTSPADKARQHTPLSEASRDSLVDFLSERPERWLQQTPPTRKDLNRLLDLMHAYFGGKDYAWVAASAVYPELHWSLTVSLKSALKDGKRKFVYDRELLTASQLPWFRQGWMPDWLRTALQLTLSAVQAQNIRRELLLAMGFNARNAKSEASLEIDFGKSDARKEKGPKADRILAEFILPSFYSSRRLLSVTAKVAANIARRPLQNVVIVSVIGAFIALFCTFAALSALPIDECDLFAASKFDPRRVGAPVQAIILSQRLPSYADRVEAACKSAMVRHPENPRFKYQYAKALWNRNPIQFFQSNIEVAAAGYPAGFDALGDAYLRGNGTNKNYAEAEASYRKAIKMGAKAANFGLWDLYHREDYEHHDIQEAFKFAKVAAEESGAAFDILALYYRDGGPIEANPEKYIEMLKRGVRYADSDAAKLLAYEYYVGHYVPREANRANELSELAALWGANPSAAYELGVSNYSGRGLLVNYEKATFWFIFAAKIGNKHALVELSNMILNGEAKFADKFVPTVSKLGFARIAAEGGKHEAQYYLGSELEKLAQNDEEKIEAIDWYRKAAAAGNLRAEQALKRLNIGRTE